MKPALRISYTVPYTAYDLEVKSEFSDGHYLYRYCLSHYGPGRTRFKGYEVRRIIDECNHKSVKKWFKAFCNDLHDEGILLVNVLYDIDECDND